ncbi:MAG TPA: 4-(cytidine 5'-diphospho)-2-C-methyl-D-erythritol kinase [Chloroflexota bacterium]|nr:4-(cytidine 5'-diphospho)-2-C-methyl-D-erythritol kinase [Chloroflexota bacterium]
MGPGQTVRVRAYAKINLALEVLGRREDGFHEIVSVVQTISLHDVVECRPASEVRVQIDPPLEIALERNLAERAAELVRAASGRRDGATLHIKRKIPLSAGLGGGSSDAAAALRGLNRLWRSGLRHAQLHGLAQLLGSDVPLFLVGGAVLVRGRGERLEPLPRLPTLWVALACPPCSSSEKTRALYDALRPEDMTDGRRTLSLADRLRSGEVPALGYAPNTFDRPAAQLYPGFEALRRRLSRAAGTALQLTGAGPSLYALFATRTEAKWAAARMAGLGVPSCLARSVGLSRVRS